MEKGVSLSKKIIHVIDGLSEWTGRVDAWLVPAMVVVMFLIVVLRYLFDTGSIAMQESVTYLHALVFMLGAAYTLRHDEHVRVDVLYRRWSATRRACVDVCGAVFFLIPVTALIAWTSFEYVADAWQVKESSREPGGLPWLYMLKTVIPITALLIFLQGIAQALRGISILLGGSAAAAEHKHGEGV
ncbi:MAG: TRAP transporter small permease subunit [Gammaproteobacteria bacterium]|nr:TRAP transporter small permease subunit [Gammaproteobacteria bacterium]